MPDDWQSRYGHRRLLLETLVEAQRFRGTCYRAANWTYVGQTTGGGRIDREHKTHGQANKDIHLYRWSATPSNASGAIRGGKKYLYSLARPLCLLPF
jgi:hypothetical protein